VAAYQRVEDALELNITAFRRFGALRFVNGRVDWTQDGGTSVGFRIQRDPAGWPELVLVYQGQQGSDPPYFSKQTFRLVSTSPKYGGRRWWFRCWCGRRCAKLYVLPRMP
jgi:hypothetical protein